MRYWEDMRVGERGRFGHHRLSGKEIAEFQERFNPLPTILVDGEMPDSGEVAPGYLLCCIGMRMLVEHFLVDMASLGSPGVDRIDWPAPAVAGDMLSLTTVLLSTRPLKSRPEMGLIKQRLVIVNQCGAEVARMWTNAFVARRDASRCRT